MNKKIVLAVAPYRFNQFYPDYQTSLPLLDNVNLVPGATGPLGIMYISSELKKKDFKVEFIDGVFETEKSFLEKIKKSKPDLLAFYVSSPLWQRTKKISRKVKKTDKNLKICVGGPHIDLKGKDILENTKNIDFAVSGDAEKIIPELAEQIENKNIDVPGVIWKKNSKIRENRPCPYTVEDLDSIEFPDRSLIDLNRYCPSIGFYRKRPSVNMVTTRGCRMACSFCHAKEKALRERSIEEVIEEFRDLEKRGVEDILLYDQDFGANKKRSIELCKRIVEEGFDFYIGCNLRIDSFDEELLRWMKKAGFWRVFYGLESGVQKNLDRVAKGITLEEIESVVKKTEEIGLQVFGSFILGIPGETYEEGLKTIEFAKKLPLTFAKFAPFSPWPGSDIWENPEKYGELEKNPRKMAMNRINFVPHTITKKELDSLLRKGFKEFYIRPSYFWKRFKQIRTFEDIKQNIRGLISFIRS